MSYQSNTDHNHHFQQNQFENPNPAKEKTYSSSSDSDGFMEKRQASSGLAGFIKNPYVCFTAIFASIGGVLFG
ncbi:hypothetical protein CU098_002821, partial [Rhizopus stolonifer]